MLRLRFRINWFIYVSSIAFISLLLYILGLICGYSPKIYDIYGTAIALAILYAYGFILEIIYKTIRRRKK